MLGILLFLLFGFLPVMRWTSLNMNREREKQNINDYKNKIKIVDFWFDHKLTEDLWCWTTGWIAFTINK